MRALMFFLCVSLFLGCSAAEKDNALFKSLDQDNDGLVSFDEYGGDQNTFMAMDQDGDGKLTEAELAAGTAEGDNNSNQNISGDTVNSADAGTTLVTPDSGGTTTVAKTPEQKCNDAVTCYTQCAQQCAEGDQLCAGQCQTTCQTDHPEGWPTYQTYEGCLMQACGTLTDQAAIQLCVLSAAAFGGACYDQASACGLEGGMGSCADMYLCIVQCTEGDVTCQNNCFMQASSAAVTQFDAWNSCLNTACGTAADQQACVTAAYEGACKAETDACGISGGGGSATCLETTICIIGCDTNDSQCQFQCQQDASQEAIDQVNDWNSCLTTACAGVAEAEVQGCYADAQAVGGACYDLTVACGLVGTQTCNDILSCYQLCTDTPCIYQCIFAGTADAQGLFTDWNLCLSENCYGAGQPCSGAGGQSPQCQKCQGDFCADDLAKCQTDGAAGWTKMENFTPAEMDPAQFSTERLLLRPIPTFFLPLNKD